MLVLAHTQTTVAELFQENNRESANESEFARSLRASHAESGVGMENWRRGALLHGGQCHCNQIVREPIGCDKHN